jgi:hypothetical protein
MSLAAGWRTRRPLGAAIERLVDAVRGRPRRTPPAAYPRCSAVASQHRRRRERCLGTPPRRLAMDRRRTDVRRALARPRLHGPAKAGAIRSLAITPAHRPQRERPARRSRCPAFGREREPSPFRRARSRVRGRGSCSCAWPSTICGEWHRKLRACRDRVAYRPPKAPRSGIRAPSVRVQLRASTECEPATLVFPSGARGRHRTQGDVRPASRRSRGWS